ncbi:MAG: MBL fold metallo-hydrolase [Muribaculaceae bacterium]|nr:MBL fold metallo-hydrolase [Muribaculaceae bacterium]
MATPKPTRSRRTSRPLDDLPNLFDMVEIDMSRDDIAGDVIAEHERQVAKARADRSVELSTARPSRRMRFVTFGSGSSGNCAFIGNEKEGVLIDAGVDAKTVTERLAENEISLSSVKGIILTHDHSDHLRYAYTLLRANKHMVLYCTPRTLNGIFRRSSISRRIRDYHKAIYKEIPFTVGPLTITAFETSHDGTDNVGFAIDYDDNHFVIATDTGYITERADFYIRRANYLMIESNYDLDMLLNGPYPNYLKARIQSPRGHMDNAETASYLSQVCSPTLTHIFLCHLSEDNNNPEIALKTVTQALQSRGLKVGDAIHDAIDAQVDVRVNVLPRFNSSPLFMLRHL